MKTMKIGFDIRPTKVKGNGIATYTSIIYKELSHQNEGIYEFIDGPVDINHSLMAKAKFYWWNQVILPRKLRKEGFNIYHATKELEMPYIKACKYITTIHDVIPLILKEQYFTSKIRFFLFYQLKLWIAIKKADIIVTDSNHSKSDIIKHFGVDESRIRVVYNCIDERYKVLPDSEKLRIKSKFGISEDTNYILGIGANEYRKNSKSLIEAFEKYKADTKNNTKLVVIGKKWKYSEVEMATSDIIYTGYVSDEDLVALYNGAMVFVFPSLYEGFGLPPLEAMHCGTPVITSNTTSLPEVVGEAAVLVEPESIDQIKDAIIKIENDNEFRENLIMKGFEQIKKFSKERTINGIKNIYNELLERKDGGEK